MATSRIDGILLVDKPAGISSHDVVAMVRRARDGIKAGHTGTLDPFATGLLIVALGRATRLIRFLPAAPKVYRATIQFGSATDTDDSTGREVESAPAPVDAMVRDAIRHVTGTIEQRPPDYSARHVGGRRAYELARKGETPELSNATVTVESWEVESFEDGVLTATITCSAGTYIRSLARDLGKLCGSAAHLSSLRRIRIGPFHVEHAVSPQESGSVEPLSPADSLAGMNHQVVDANEAGDIQHGRSVAARIDGSQVALIDDAGELLAVAEREGEWWLPRVVISGG